MAVTNIELHLHYLFWLLLFVFFSFELNRLHAHPFAYVIRAQ